MGSFMHGILPTVSSKYLFLSLTFLVETFQGACRLIICSFVCVYCAVLSKVCLHWNDYSLPVALCLFEVCVDIIFAVDILVNFLTAYYDPDSNKIITELRLIALRYLKGYFFVDVLAILPFSYIIFASPLLITSNLGTLSRLSKLGKFLTALTLTKALKAFKLHQFLMKLETKYFIIHRGMSRFLKIMMLVLLTAHFAGCFWYLVGISGGDNYSRGWVHRLEYDNKTTFEQYVASLYWSFTTLGTIGYGDISAGTPYEQIYSIFVMIVGISLYAYLVSSLTTVMSTFDAKENAAQDKRVRVSAFIHNAQLPEQLGRRVRECVDFKLSHSRRDQAQNSNIDEILNELSLSLRRDVLLHMERGLISKIPFFEGKSAQFIADTITLIRPFVFQEGEFIVKEGSQAEEM